MPVVEPTTETYDDAATTRVVRSLMGKVERHQTERRRIAAVLRAFVLQPITAATLQPVLDLARELNPDLPSDASR